MTKKTLLRNHFFVYLVPAFAMFALYLYFGVNEVVYSYVPRVVFEEANKTRIYEFARYYDQEFFKLFILNYFIFLSILIYSGVFGFRRDLYEKNKAISALVTVFFFIVANYLTLFYPKYFNIYDRYQEPVIPAVRAFLTHYIPVWFMHLIFCYALGLIIGNFVRNSFPKEIET